MIFSTQNQLTCILIFIFFGITLGLFFSLCKIIFLEKYQKKLIKTIFLTLFYCNFVTFFIFLLNFFNYGKQSLSLICSYLLGFVLINHLLKKSVVIFQNLWYNILKKTFCKKSKKEQKINNEISNES